MIVKMHSTFWVSFFKKMNLMLRTTGFETKVSSLKSYISIVLNQCNHLQHHTMKNRDDSMYCMISFCF